MLKTILQILIILMLFGSIPSAIYQGKVIAYPECKASEDVDECIKLMKQLDKFFMEFENEYRF